MGKFWVTAYWWILAFGLGFEILMAIVAIASGDTSEILRMGRSIGPIWMGFVLWGEVIRQTAGYEFAIKRIQEEAKGRSDAVELHNKVNKERNDLQVKLSEANSQLDKIRGIVRQKYAVACSTTA